MDTIRVGFVGLGGICRQRHVPGLLKIPGVVLQAICNRSRGSSEAAAREFDIPIVCDTWKDLISREDIDAVFIGTWPYMHHPISIAALEAGKHVFCQARMAMHYGEAQEMAAAARAANRVAMLCPVPFGLSIDQTILRMLREKTLGDVYLVRVQGLSDIYTDPRTAMNWRKDHRLSGLNMITLGMYIEVIHRWFGPTKSVAALTQIFTSRRPDETGQMTEVRIPDQILFHAEMNGGTAVQYVISGVAAQGRDAIELYGTQGALYYDVPADVLYRIDSSGNRHREEILPEDAYDVRHWRVEQDFVDAIRCGSEYHPSFEDGLRYMQVIQAVHDSSTSRCTIHLEN